MLNARHALIRIAPLALGCLSLDLGLVGCASQPAVAKASPAAATGSPPASVEPAPAAAPVEPEPAAAAPPAAAMESPGFAEAVARLRPAAALSAITALEAAPTDAEAYASAALAFAPSDVPGMTLIWGMTYRAMGGGKSDGAVANALAKVLNERISIQPKEEGKDMIYNLRLAPGQMPARQQPDGSVEAPLAHVFEGLFGGAVLGFRPPWTIEQFYDSLSKWTGVVSARGTPLDGKLELNGWLVTLAKAGHLEAYCHRLLGTAFAAELKAYKATHAAELKAFDGYVKSTPLVPSRAAMPDDLVRIK